MTLAHLYARGWSTMRIVRETGLRYNMVRRRLHAEGVRMRHRSARGAKCLDCGKPIVRGKRCQFHSKIRHAERQREWAREKYHYKALKWTEL